MSPVPHVVLVDAHARELDESPDAEFPKLRLNLDLRASLLQ